MESNKSVTNMKLKKVSLKSLFEEHASKEPEKKIMNMDDVFAFGKHKGKTLREVIEKHAGYVHWCLREGIFELNEDECEY